MSPSRRRWRDYQSASGNRPVKDFLFGLALDHRAEIVAAMRDIREHGLAAARHVRGEIYEVRADAGSVTYRILFATEGRSSQVLLSLEAFAKRRSERLRPESSLPSAASLTGEAEPADLVNENPIVI